MCNKPQGDYSECLYAYRNTKHLWEWTVVLTNVQCPFFLFVLLLHFHWRYDIDGLWCDEITAFDGDDFLGDDFLFYSLATILYVAHSLLEKVCLVVSTQRMSSVF